VDELCATHQLAEDAMTKPPYPQVEQLEPQLKFAHEMYNSLPEKLSNDALKKTKLTPRSWF
jgi:hypothetical protein